MEAEGYDVSVNYTFSIDANDFGISVVGTRQDKLNRYFNPLDQSDVDIGIEEVQTPKTAGNIELSWTRGDLSMAIQTTTKVVRRTAKWKSRLASMAINNCLVRAAVSMAVRLFTTST